MRSINKLAVAISVILFALSGSVYAEMHDSTNREAGKKAYKICKSWRQDQGGPMPTDQMQHCRNVMEAVTTANCSIHDGDGYSPDADCITKAVREEVKGHLGYW